MAMTPTEQETAMTKQTPFQIGDWPTYYGIQATRTLTDAQGWTFTRQLPTFFLGTSIQGITSLQDAEKRAILQPAANEVLAITVYPVHGEIGITK